MKKIITKNDSNSLELYTSKPVKEVQRRKVKVIVTKMRDISLTLNNNKLSNKNINKIISKNRKTIGK